MNKIHRIQQQNHNSNDPHDITGKIKICAGYVKTVKPGYVILRIFEHLVIKLCFAVKLMHFISLNPRLTEGGRKTPPLPTFHDRSKTAADIDAKLLVPSSASIWRLPPKFQKNPLRNFWENDVLVTSCFAISGQKAANVCRLPECAILK